MATRKKNTKKKAGKGGSENPVKIERFTQQLTVALTREELEERGQRSAHMIADRDQKKAELKEHTKEVNSEISKLDLEIRRLSADIREKVTLKDVLCERRFLYKLGVVRDVRTDTGETIFERPMTDQEKQADLPFDGKGGDVDDEFGGDDDNDDETDPDDKAAE